MTAIVGILNKHAVAIAADSALTVINNGSRKIYNTSQKIFPLSEKNPVAIMTYDSAAFMGVPWEVIINLYRNERGNKMFGAMSEYCDDFLDFIRNSDYFSGEENQKWYFMRELRYVYNKLTTAANARAEEEIAGLEEPAAEQRKAIIRKHLMDVLKELPELCREDGKVEELKGCSFKKFERITEECWEEFLDDIDIDEDLKDKWHQVMYEYITSEYLYKCTGLVFIGYGSKDLFPSYYSVYVSGIFNGKLRWCKDDHDEITVEGNTASIRSFAQDDVIMTMVKGIEPDFFEHVLEENERELDSYRENVNDILEEAGVSKDIIAKVNGIDKNHYKEVYQIKLENFIDENNIRGIMDAVESFNVEDLTNMAGSLISITNLQRHFSSSEESVGGPVEVAVITKADGFKWVKHKS